MQMKNRLKPLAMKRYLAVKSYLSTAVAITITNRL